MSGAHCLVLYMTTDVFVGATAVLLRLPCRQGREKPCPYLLKKTCANNNVLIYYHFFHYLTRVIFFSSEKDPN